MQVSGLSCESAPKGIISYDLVLQAAVNGGHHLNRTPFANY